MNVAKIMVLIMQLKMVFKKIADHVSYFYHLHFAKTPFIVAHKKWIQDCGDGTLRLDYNLNPGSVVLDVGGYLGDFADVIHKKYQCFVFVFEPVEDFFRLCQQRFDGQLKINCLNYGLSKSDCEIFISKEDDASSTERDLGGRKERIALKDFVSAKMILDIEYIDLIKINIEGGEYDLLDRIIETGGVKNIKYLQIQFHDFVPNAIEMRESIRKRLVKTHREQWSYPFVWESWERL